jgi:hypothetical protein
MLFKDRLFSKYGDSLSLSGTVEELKSFGLSFTPKLYHPTTLIPCCGVLFSFHDGDKRKIIKIEGNIYLSLSDELSSEDVYNILMQVDSILEKQTFPPLLEMIKKILILNRYESK